MIRLVSYNAHGNGVSVFNDTKNNVFYKVASNGSTVSGLKKEKTGWDWYFDQVLRSKISAKIFLKKDSYARLEIFGFKGKQINYTETPEKTIRHVERFVDYYLSYWPKDKHYSYHGDLTLSNIIWGDIPYVIDWEHFGNKKIFWGFDIIYLVLSILFLPYKKLTIPSKKNLKILGSIFVKLEKNGVEKRILEKPVAEVKKAIENFILPSTNCEKTKFFLLNYSELEADIMDECLVRAYRYAVYDQYLDTLKEK